MLAALYLALVKLGISSALCRGVIFSITRNHICQRDIVAPRQTDSYVDDPCGCSYTVYILLDCHILMLESAYGRLSMTGILEETIGRRSWLTCSTSTSYAYIKDEIPPENRLPTFELLTPLS